MAFTCDNPKYMETVSEM